MKKLLEKYEQTALEVESCYTHSNDDNLEMKLLILNDMRHEILYRANDMLTRGLIKDRAYMKIIELIELIDQEIEIYKETHEWLKEKQSA